MGKAYRDKGREAGIEVGEMMGPVTAHAAFDKAAELLGMSIRHVPVDEVTKRVKVETMSRMISSRTVMLVGSAPQFRRKIKLGCVLRWSCSCSRQKHRLRPHWRLPRLTLLLRSCRSGHEGKSPRILKKCQIAALPK